jgi:CBS domain-containing protein
LDTPVSDAVRLLLSSTFTGVPVVDKKNHPAGVISQGDLIYRGGMPARLGLLAESGADHLKEVLASLSAKNAEDIMSPAVCIRENELLTEAVRLMLKRDLKRLPVTDEQGKLTGILSRMDIFRTISDQSPDWKTILQQNIPVGNLKYISDIMRRDTHTVFPETPVEEVLRVIDSDDIQRVAVVDRNGAFMGLISDRNLLAAFSDHKEGIWEYFVSKLPFGERGRENREFNGRLRSKTAAEVMKTDVITVPETATIDEAIRVMTEKMIKRLPVLDAEGKFKGMISRESLLRTGFSTSQDEK